VTGEARTHEQLLRAAADGYGQMIGLDLDDLSVGGAITTRRCWSPPWPGS
jgi:hypothetical protein